MKVFILYLFEYSIKIFCDLKTRIDEELLEDRE